MPAHSDFLYAWYCIQIFGTYVPPVVNHDAELVELKAKVDISHGVYLEKQAEIRRAKRAALDAEFARLCNHVHERMEEIAANEEKAREAAVLAEVKRVQQRALDREMRRGKRFEEYLEREREHMVYEDARSYTVSLRLFVVLRWSCFAAV
jgi:hypothetical protein